MTKKHSKKEYMSTMSQYVNDHLSSGLLSFRHCKGRDKKKMSKEPLDIYITYITLYITFPINLVLSAVRHAVL